MQFGIKSLGINNKVVSYRPTIHSNSELFKKNKTEKAPMYVVSIFTEHFVLLLNRRNSLLAVPSCII